MCTHTQHPPEVGVQIAPDSSFKQNPVCSLRALLSDLELDRLIRANVIIGNNDIYYVYQIFVF